LKYKENIEEIKGLFKIEKDCELSRQEKVKNREAIIPNWRKITNSEQTLLSLDTTEFNKFKDDQQKQYMKLLT